MRISDWSSDVCSSDLASRQYAAPTKRSGYRGSARSLWSPNIKRAPQRREHRQNPSKLDSWLAPLQVHKESHANAAGGGKLCLTQTERLAFLANDFSYGISVEHHGFPDRKSTRLNSSH